MPPLPVSVRNHVPDAALVDVSPGQPSLSAKYTLSDRVVNQVDGGLMYHS